MELFSIRIRRTFQLVSTVRGEYHGVPYTGIVYAATDDAGKVVSLRSRAPALENVLATNSWKNGCFST